MDAQNLKSLFILMFYLNEIHFFMIYPQMFIDLSLFPSLPLSLII